VLPARRPRLLAQRRADEARAAQDAVQQRAREITARQGAAALERDRVRRRRANTPFVRGLETAGGWLLSILGALIVSIVLTWLLRHPSEIDALLRVARSAIRVR
jgi:hypothetical protein